LVNAIGYRWVVLISILFLATGLASAKTLYVDAGGDADFTTIGGAISAANTSDEIIVYNATYNEVVTLSKQVNLTGIDYPLINASGNAVVISTNGAAVEGFRIAGSKYGVHIYGRSSNLIRNNLITGITGSIFIMGAMNPIHGFCGIASHSNKVINNSIQGDIFLYCTYLEDIINNSISGGHNSINAIETDGISIVGNVIFNNDYAIFLQNSRAAELSNNTLLNNNYSLYVTGRSLYEYTHEINASNTINGKPVLYVMSKDNITIDSANNSGFIGVINSNNITVRNLAISNSYQGILLAYTDYSNIENVTLTDNHHGVYLDNSDDNSINNNFIDNSTFGISLQESDGNHIFANEIRNSSSIYLTSIYNTSIRLDSSSGNLVYHNNLINNSGPTGYDNDGSNLWDNGSEGNYWSDYTGPDSNSDGIGDTPYGISGSSVSDRYPLMAPYWICEKGDFDCDGVINLLDLTRFENVYGLRLNDSGYDSTADFDNNGVIDFIDFVRFARVYGQ